MLITWQNSYKCKGLGFLGVIGGLVDLVSLLCVLHDMKVCKWSLRQCDSIDLLLERIGPEMGM